jgi:hypothetical protein
MGYYVVTRVTACSNGIPANNERGSTMTKLQKRECDLIAAMMIIEKMRAEEENTDVKAALGEAERYILNSLSMVQDLMKGE